jgi:phosphatidylglycerol:prolipoprotein diacylglycerol transferase
MEDLFFYIFLAVIIGGRIGYILFYNINFYIERPLDIFKVWEGGMSFHGGLIGTVVSQWIYSRKSKIHTIDLLDFFAPMVPLGLAAGRFGNFINGELWGRVTTSFMGMKFPLGGPLPRYPSQLIEMVLEGFILFIILWLSSIKPKSRWLISALFLILYGHMRFIAEFFREPDQIRGYVLFNWMTEGQLLSIPMVILGFIILLFIINDKRV